MTPQVYAMAVVVLLNVAFTAGGVYVLVRLMRKDLNGLGTKLGSLQRIADDRYLTMALVIMLLCPEEKRERAAEMIKDYARGK